MHALEVCVTTVNDNSAAIEYAAMAQKYQIPKKHHKFPGKKTEKLTYLNTYSLLVKGKHLPKNLLCKKAKVDPTSRTAGGEPWSPAKG